MSGRRASAGRYHLDFSLLAPARTVAMIREPEATLNTAAVPSKLPLVAPVGSVQNLDDLSPLARGGPCSHERTKTYKLE
jgi:hypothetical protein